jgi:hypothetical protein
MIGTRRRIGGGMRKQIVAIAALAMIALAASAHAEDESPAPFLYDNGDFFYARTRAVDDTHLGITPVLDNESVATAAQAGPVAAAFLYYTRPRPLASVRYSFRLDTSALTGATLGNRGFQVFAASAPVVLASTSQMLLIRYAGGDPQPALLLTAARGGDVPIQSAAVPITQTINTVRVEINTGAGAAGNVRYWINAAFDDPPTGVLDSDGAGLDNAAWGGVIAAAIGVSSTTSNFRAACGGSVTIDQIESSDDQLFWDDNETGPK